MSRKYFPRVAPRTLPKLKRQPRLPKLRVAVYDHDELVKVMEYDDPRADFCDKFNSQYGGAFGLRAEPLTVDEAKAARKILARKAVGQ